MAVRVGMSCLVAAAITGALLGCSSSKSTGPSGGGTISLGVGGVAVVSSAKQLAKVQIAATGGASQFLIVVANADTGQDQTQSYTLSSSAGDRLTSQYSRASRLGPEGQEVPRGPAGRGSTLNVAQLAFEGRLRAFERTHLHFPPGGFRPRGGQPPSGGVGVRCVPSQQPEGVCPTPNPPVPSTVVVGDTVSLHVPTGPNNLCTQYASTRAVVRAVSTHAIVVEDTLDHIAGPTFSASDFQAVGSEYDTFIYPTDVNHFGTPTDIDHNGHVLLLYTGQVNKLTVPGEQGFVGGFFFNGDLFPDTNTTSFQQCAESNYAEIFYLLAPDPANAFGGGAHTTADVRQLTRGTVGHEFQHMINAGNRLYNCAQCTSFEITWLDEALAHSAEDWVGRAEDGFSDAQQLTFADITAHGNADFNAFFYQNAARFGFWLKAPATHGVTSVFADTSLAVRGAAWSMVEYSADQHGGGNIAAFTHALAAGPQVGVQNLVARAGVPFDSLLSGWLIANFASGAGISGLNAKYSYTGYNMRDVQDNLNSGNYPLVVNDASPGASGLLTPVNSATGAYYIATTSGQAFALSLAGANGTGAPATGARIYVVRLQ
jgi:hypothetical protein